VSGVIVQEEQGLLELNLSVGELNIAPSSPPTADSSVEVLILSIHPILSSLSSLYLIYSLPFILLNLLDEPLSKQLECHL